MTAISANPRNSTRLRPLKAMRAFRVLQATGDTRQVFVILRAMRGKALINTFRRFAQSALGKKVLAERRDLLPALADREGLRSLPQDSLGRAYLAFMEEEQLSAEGLVQASESWEDDPMPPDIDLFRARMRELHDVSHVVTGYGRDPLGELCLLAFTYRQFGNLGRLLIVAMAWSQIPKPGRAAVFEAWRNGKSCAWLGDQDWEALLARPLDEVRRSLSLSLPRRYPPAAV
jgi:ubiquinone biosynthesis protein COQ4